ncbi:MAG: hypothetical protein CMP83_03395 [Gammaproteobacteria bacterium]|nr:hypothetical protein [Gammaproteobacteria bacterium]
MSEQTTKPEPSLSSLLARDTAIALAALSLWAAADTWYLVSGLGFALAVSVLDAIFVGYILGALFHEWGHYTGAKISGASAPRVKSKGSSLFRFNFDMSANTQRQFHWMSFGGWVFHWGLLAILVLALPFDSIGRIALVSSVFGFILYATFIETGILRKTLGGSDPAETLGQLSAKTFQQAGIVGSVAGLFALATLN